MDDPIQPRKIRTYEFSDRGGRTIDERGKAHWPDQLTLNLTNTMALEMIAEVARAVSNNLSEEENQGGVRLTFCGKLDEYDEDED